MNKTCNNHAANPARIYHQCVGCELEWYQKRTEELEAEAKGLREVIDRQHILLEQYEVAIS